MAGSATHCGVCAAAPRKYRCPTCDLRTCSAACFAAHKPACAPPRTVAAPALAAVPGGVREVTDDAADGGAGGGGAPLLPDAALARLAADAGVVSALHDPRLRRTIASVDAAPDRAAALADALRGPDGPAFAAFVDDMLVCVGAAHRDAAAGVGDGRRSGGVVFDG